MSLEPPDLVTVAPDGRPPEEQPRWRQAFPIDWPQDDSPFARSQRMIILLGIVCLIAVIVILQLWLFTATMEAYLGGDQAIVVPAALASLACLGLNAGLVRYLRALDR